MIEVKEIIDLSKSFPNDGDLGREYRKLSLLKLNKLDEFTMKFPNDFDLGKFLRKKIKN